MSRQINILLSGSTGILGSHVLFELLFLFATREFTGKLGLIVRPSSGISLRKNKRIESILKSEFIPDFLKPFSPEELLEPVFLIHKEIHEVKTVDFPIDFTEVLFIHAAGSVNLANSSDVFQEIEFNNFEGTRSVLNQTIPFLRKFIFISTAYATGHRDGLIDNDFLSFQECNFRNPYETFKNKTEKSIVDICSKNKIDWQILRPSIICGRTIDLPLYFIPRFPVFYLIGKYFYLLKKCTFNTPSIRVFAPLNSGLNIIPADYLAKAIVRSVFLELKQINLVHSAHISIADLFRIGKEEMDFPQLLLVSQPVSNPSVFEKRYENIVNPQLLPYLDTPEHSFDSGIIRQIMADFQEPDVLGHFSGLIRFAVSHHFKTIY